MESIGIGVFGGEKGFRSAWGCRNPESFEISSRSGISESSDVICPTICGISIVGIGTSAAATEARN
jgi:hypothetical protein